MAYTTVDARKQLLDALAEAADELALALACLGEAYEQLDEHAGDRLEEELFRPVQTAYGRAKRAHSEFAARHGLPGRTLESRSPGLASQGAKAFIQRGVGAAGQAGQAIAVLQDSMLPVEVGDAQLRAELAEVRELIDGLPARAREFLRGLGR
jgi:hypothetical protein